MMGCRRNLSPDGANQTAKAGLLAENPPNRAAPVCWTQRRVPPPRRAYATVVACAVLPARTLRLCRFVQR